MNVKVKILTALVLSSIFSMNAWAEGETATLPSSNYGTNEPILTKGSNCWDSLKAGKYSQIKLDSYVSSENYKDGKYLDRYNADTNTSHAIFLNDLNSNNKTAEINSSDFIVGNINDLNNEHYNNGAFGVRNSKLTINTDIFKINNSFTGIEVENTNSIGINQGLSYMTVTAEGNIEINTSGYKGVYTEQDENGAKIKGVFRTAGIYGSVTDNETNKNIGIVKIDVKSKNGNINIQSKRTGIYGNRNVSTHLVADSGQINIKATQEQFMKKDGSQIEGIGIYLINDYANAMSAVTLKAKDDITIEGDTQGIRTRSTKGNASIDIESTENNITIKSKGENITDNNLDAVNAGIGIIGNGFDPEHFSTMNLTAKNGSVTIDAVNKGIQIRGAYNQTINAGNVYIHSANDDAVYNSGSVVDPNEQNGDSQEIKSENVNSVIINASMINISGGRRGIFDTQHGNNAIDGYVELDSGNNTIYGKTAAVSGYVGGDIRITAENTNIITGGDTALAAYDDSVITVKGKENHITGLVSSGYQNNLDYIKSENGDTSSITITGGLNKIISGSAVKEFTAGGNKDGKDVRVAVFAASDSKNNHITIEAVDGGKNIIGINDDKRKDLQRTVWAYNGGRIFIKGTSVIYASDTYSYSENGYYDGLGVALAAGSGNKGLENENLVQADLGSGSLVYGAVLSGYKGNIKVNGAGKDKIMMIGDVLAGNGGSVNVNIGNQGTLVGHADTYMDAGADKVFENSYFSQSVESPGHGEIVLGTGSTWNVTAQSWIDKVSLQDKNAVIDMVNADIGSVGSTHAMTIGSLEGSGTLKMHLQRDRKASDMLYIGNTSGNTYNIELNEVVTTDDMYADGHTGLRFATLGKGSDANFKVTAKDQGMYNVQYLVGTDDFDTSTENKDYNLEKQDTAYKPGNDTVTTFLSRYNKDEQPESEKTHMLFAAEDSAENQTAAKETKKTGATNYKLIAGRITGLTDAGKTVLMQAQANYKNAVYMDRLNKRLGEVRYINDREDAEKDEGMWVRVLHDRIGMENSFRSRNTMYEIGYDKQQECDSGERRFGAAFDYMRGSTEYSHIYGKGKNRRAGLWFYDTWMGTKGHYADYVAKWGHLSSEFDILAGDEQVTGDYSNNVYSFSAEYGRKKDMGKNWYVEPQAQLQFAHVTSADYVTSQNTKLELDGVNSLIGRLGFRLGKNYGTDKKGTVYLKADVLHEFLGDQEIRALDRTTDNRWSGLSFENKGTWYDVGFGFAAETGRNSYMYMDFEKSFGNGNEDTYQINAGVQWSF